MKVYAKLSLAMAVVVITAVLPVSLYILKTQEEARIEQVKTSGLAQSRFISRSVMNFLLLNGGNLNATKVDSNDLVKQFETLKKSGLVSLFVIFLSQDKQKNGTVLAAWPPVDSPLNADDSSINLWLQNDDYSIENCGTGNETCFVFQSKSGIQNGPPLVLTRLSFSKEAVLSEVLLLRNSLLTIIWLAIPVVFVVGAYFNRVITRPLEYLEEATRQIQAGNLDYRVNIQTADEFGKLGSSFNNMSVSIQKYIKELSEHYEELNAASTIQKALLPKSLPRHDDVLFYASFTPMAEVGGDLYDIIKDDHGYGILVADVSGHGVPAALVTAMAKMVIAGRRDLLSKPAEMVTWLNHSLCGSTGNRFVTLVYGYYSMDDKKFTFANAGHPEVLVVKREKRTIETHNTKGGMVGLFPELTFEQKTLQLCSGDRLVLFTDGITECHSLEMIMFEDENLHHYLRSTTQLDGETVCNGLIETLFQYTGNKAHLEDDATILILDIA